MAKAAAVFDRPARAIRCACTITGGVRSLGIAVRAGVHASECEVIDDKLCGLAVRIAARVATLADAGEVLVSGTVEDLVVGAGFSFMDRGVRTLKGVPGEWHLYVVDEHGVE
jgi:class 3 adenylate cyclase